MNRAETKRPDLSVIVPVFNAADSIERLVTQFVEIPDLAVQILLVDDCSTDDSAATIRNLTDKHHDVEGLYHETNLGAGIARNTAFERATGHYTIFFDADDIVHGGAVSDAVIGLRETGAEMAMMPYFYRRDEISEHDAMNLHDAKIWNQVTMGQHQSVVTLNEAASLLGFSNYPWNKVLLTDHYKSVGLRFGKTTVNNDILGHWYSLLFAEKILLLSTEVCTHIVVSQGDNLTNQHSRVRMQLFDALDETYDLLEAHSVRRARYSHHYWSLAVRTTRWAAARISSDMRSEFNVRFQQHAMRIDLDDYSRIRQKRSPQLADSILKLSLS